MKKMIAVLALSLWCLRTFAQEKTTTTIPYRSFIAEVGGPGVLFSVNYDTRFKKTPFGFGGRIGVGFTPGYQRGTYVIDPVSGFGYYTGNGKEVSVLTVPVQLNYLFGKEGSKSALEIGAGATYVGKNSDFFYYEDDSRKARIYGNTSFMYRRMPTDGGFSWRVGFTPLIGNGLIQASAAASVGFNF